MSVINIPKDEHFITSGTRMKEIYWLVKGKVSQLSHNDELIFEGGSVIGIPECAKGDYLCDYVALEDCTFYTYPYTDKTDLVKIYETQPKYFPVFMMAVMKTTVETVKKIDRYCKEAKEFYNLCIDLQRQYRYLASKYEIPEKTLRRMDYLTQLKLTEPFPTWKVEYYEEIAKQPIANIEAFYANNVHLLGGFVLSAGEDISLAIRLIDESCDYFAYNRDILLCGDRKDMLSLYFELAKKAALMGRDYAPVLEKIEAIKAFLGKVDFIDSTLKEERLAEMEHFDFASYTTEDENAENDGRTEDAKGQGEFGESEEGYAEGYEDDYYDEDEDEGEGEDCLAHILRYAGYDDGTIEKIRDYIIAYRGLPDMLATDDETRKLRKRLSDIFYDTYIAAFKHSLDDHDLSPIMEMFFNFGFMDVSLADEENANMLYDMTEQLFLCESENVYTIYRWLKSIYEGKNEPSRNGFDLDYLANLREERKQGHISAAEEETLKDDAWNKVVFEIRNLFTTTNRATYGRITTFCPLLSKHDLIDSPMNMLLTVSKLQAALNAIREVDYSVFYHDVVFSDPEHGITKEVLKKEILPQIILMPNAGTRAMMWQEVGGTRRDTPARFIFPIFTKASVEDLMLETVARYRWEYCRRIQGARWNDVTDKSLTAEYCDYLQFYRKNRELSTELKEKLRNELFRAKNNFREVFVKDYISWMKYEASGSFRLNKITREIMATYCPFAARYRAALVKNPMFQALLERRAILGDREKKRVVMVFDKYKRSGGEMTPEILENLEYYEK